MKGNGAYWTIARILPMPDPTFPSFKLEELRDSVVVGIVWPIDHEPETKMSLKKIMRNLIA